MISDNFHKFAALACFGAVDAVCSVLFGSLSGLLPLRCLIDQQLVIDIVSEGMS